MLALEVHPNKWKEVHLIDNYFCIFLARMLNINITPHYEKELKVRKMFSLVFVYMQERKPELATEIMGFRDYLLSSTISDTLAVWELKGIYFHSSCKVYGFRFKYLLIGRESVLILINHFK